MPEKLDEQALRRPDFVPGAPVVLADGQTYYLRRPVVRFVPDDTHESGFEVRLTLAGEDEFAALMKKREAAFESSEFVSVSEVAGAELRVGRMILLANYDLTPDQVASLLQFGYDAEADPEGSEIRDAVMDVATGRGKKPEAGTSAA